LCAAQVLRVPVQRVAKYEEYLKTTPLHELAQFGLATVVEKVVFTQKPIKITVNAGNSSGDTPLSLAAAQGHREMVTLLLNNQANVNAQGGEYGHALQVALAGGHKRVVMMLLNAGAHPAKQVDPVIIEA
jgi:hypothetical protein